MGASQSTAVPKPGLPAACPAGQEADQPPSACPVPKEYRNPAIYNVYGQRLNEPGAEASTNPLSAERGSDLLDPKNNMPLEPNQQPCPGQRRPLSTERLQSNIPKGGTDSTWTYPSPQMFFNGGCARKARVPPCLCMGCDAGEGASPGALVAAAHKPLPRRCRVTALKRKGKGEDVAEDHMDAVVRAHNSECGRQAGSHARLIMAPLPPGPPWQALPAYTAPCPPPACRSHERGDVEARDHLGAAALPGLPLPHAPALPRPAR